jgi:hypothetical protein
MKTKNILIYGAIAAGAYLAYKYFMKPKAEANFANANGGVGSIGTPLAINQFDAWVAAYVKLKKYPTYIWKSCRDMVVKIYYQNLKQNKLMSNIGMQQMFEICVSQKLLNMQNQANLGSSSVRNTATM